MPHLPYDELPPLADYDRARHLIDKSFAQLDPQQRKGKPRRYLFWGLMAVFRKSLWPFLGQVEQC